MKVAPLLVASVAGLETSTSASALLAAVGKRNVTHMEALIQGLAEESVTEPGWKFDKDIKDALDAIRTMFVKSIQDALMDQHKVDQEAHNCNTESCFKKCRGKYTDDDEKCEEMKEVCHKKRDEHVECRTNVYKLYKDMAKKCSALHCFEPCKVECQYEKCICPDVLTCHQGKQSKDKDEYGDEATKYTCKAKGGGCASHGYGAWLQGVITCYESSWKEWYTLWGECSEAYRVFLYADVECDGKQREFEKCMCEKDFWKNSLCTNDFSSCQSRCWDQYEVDVPNLQCQEKDRKIDWSATKKIECYLDVLLHDYTKKELLEECGSETCVNVAREKSYKHCSTICQRVDHDGVWSTPDCDREGNVKMLDGTHAFRQKHDHYHMGDSHYKCDANGPEVHTDHRGGGVDRKGELRCTEHLDIDFQTPPCYDCIPCDPKTEVCEVCDEAFHCLYYEQFDQTDKIKCINDCCPLDAKGGKGGCFPEVTIESCSAKECDETGKNCEATEYGGYEDGWVPSTNDITFGEHTHAWAYNRCECMPCKAELPSYPDPPVGRECCSGAHTIHGGAYGL